jgi:pSer/pThr/pTyr-binding forkhead associated (FHA) protein
MTEPVVIQATAGALTGRQWAFSDPDLVVVGKEADCTLRLPADDAYASRHHALIEVRPPRVVVRDLGSLNGTYVNDEKIGARAPTETPEQGRGHVYREVELRDQDVVRLSGTELRVTVPRAMAGTPPQPAVPQAADSVDDPAELLIRLLLQRGRGRQPSAPRTIPGYQLGRMLGQGGMGAVYLARRLRDDAQVAVKVMLAEAPAGSQGRQMFEREFAMQQRMGDHPNCVPVLDYGLADRGAFFVMEFCPGGSVDVLMQRRGGRLGVAEAAPIMLDALQGLAHAHAHDVVHRDLKPQNILLSVPDGGTARLTDFGLAKDFELAGMSGMTRTGAVGGTPVFLPREQVVDFKYAKPDTDVCGMAATFYNLLTGCFWRDFPSDRDPINVLLSEPVIPIRRRDPALPRGLAAVIDRAASDDPAQRYPTAREFRDALLEVL